MTVQPFAERSKARLRFPDQDIASASAGLESIYAGPLALSDGAARAGRDGGGGGSDVAGREIHDDWTGVMVPLSPDIGGIRRGWKPG